MKLDRHEDQERLSDIEAQTDLDGTLNEVDREEIRQIFAAKGFEGETLEMVVETITADNKRWIDTMLTEEMGYSLIQKSPFKAASSTMAAFLLIGLIPLSPFVLELAGPEWMGSPYRFSTVMTGAAFFVVGAVKSRFVQQKWYWSGLETLSVGGAAAGLAYLVGMALGGLAG